MAPTLAEAIDVARGKAFVILDGTLLRIDRVGMTGGRDRPYYSGKHKVHGLNVQVLADPAGRLIWISPPLPGARHDMGAAREHGIIDALNTAGISTIADTAYQGGGPAVRVPQRRRRLDPDTGRYRRLSHSQKQVNTAHARQRGPGERANAELKNWKVLRKIRSSPSRADRARRSRSNPDDRQRLIRLAKPHWPVRAVKSARYDSTEHIEFLTLRVPLRPAEAAGECCVRRRSVKCSRFY